MTTEQPSTTEPTDGSEQALKLHPDTPIKTVDLSRVGEIFTAEGLEFRLEDQPVGEDGETAEVLRTGFSNAAIAMQVRDSTLICDSVWRGDIPASEGPKVLSLVNQWNTEHFAPTLRFFEAADNNLAVSAVRELHIAEGASRNQIGAFVMSTLDSVLQSFAWIEQHYPQLVTWEEHNHDESN